MKIAVLLGSSQAKCNDLVYQALTRLDSNLYEIINFGAFPEELSEFSYVETSILISLLLSSNSVDFVVTGCSSGQGMMLAYNALPNVICGYTPTAKDAYLFGRINNGNAISIPLGLYSDFSKKIEIESIVDALFIEPLGLGYPKEQAHRKIVDSNLVKELYKENQKDIINLLITLETKALKKVLSKKNIIQYITKYSDNQNLLNALARISFT